MFHGHPTDSRRRHHGHLGHNGHIWRLGGRWRQWWRARRISYAARPRRGHRHWLRVRSRGRVRQRGVASRQLGHVRRRQARQSVRRVLVVVVGDHAGGDGRHAAGQHLPGTLQTHHHTFHKETGMVVKLTFKWSVPQTPLWIWPFSARFLSVPLPPPSALTPSPLLPLPLLRCWNSYKNRDYEHLLTGEATEAYRCVIRLSRLTELIAWGPETIASATEDRFPVVVYVHRNIHKAEVAWLYVRTRGGGGVYGLCGRWWAWGGGGAFVAADVLFQTIFQAYNNFL